MNCHNSYKPSVYGLVLVPDPPVILTFDFRYKVGLTALLYLLASSILNIVPVANTLYTKEL